MPKKRKNRSKWVIWAISGIAVMAFIGLATGAVSLLLSQDDKRAKRVHTVTLLKPPPPPKVKEKPPEPEVAKKEEIIEQQEEIEPKPMDEALEDEGPMDDDLGLDADGTAGADGFGLRAKKGGRNLIGGSFSSANLLRKYAWYTSILQEGLRKKVNQHMESNGGVPKGDHTALIKITLDACGQITDLAILRSSGNQKMDLAMKEALYLSRVEEPPPNGMPKTMRLKISSKG